MDSSSKAPQDDPDPELGLGPSYPPQTLVGVPPSPTTVAAMRKEKGRVRFNSNAGAPNPPAVTPPPNLSPDHRNVPISKPRPSVLRGNSANSIPTVQSLAQDPSQDPSQDPETRAAAEAAQERARQMAVRVQKERELRESPGTSRVSLESNAETAYSEVESELYSNDSSIPLQNLSRKGKGLDGFQQVPSQEESRGLKDEAFNLVRAHTQRFGSSSQAPKEEEAIQDDHPVYEERNDGLYDGVYDVPAPEQYRGSVLSQLLKLYNNPGESSRQHHRNTSTTSFGGASTPTVFGSESGGTTTPNKKKWYDQNRSQETLLNLVEASARLANPNDKAQKDPKDTKDPKAANKKRPAQRRTGSASRLSGLWRQEESRITVHIAETLSRQDYIIKLCRALMIFGAPTHRLEEYLQMTARVLEIDGQFLYLPGCMIISFDDRSTHTTEVRIVRTAQGIDLGKLKDTHKVYKEVMHDVVGVEEATEKLEDLMKAKDKFNAWVRVLVFGLTSVTAAPFSFKARPIDLPFCFLFGCLVGWLQLIVAPRSNLYSNVLEVSATVLVSFLARAFGSLRGGELFCFSALAQGGIVMLLPGYMVLCSSLELQSRAIVPGSIRIVYAIIYSLLLGFGITVGAALYGIIDPNATSRTECLNPPNPYYGFIFVPFFVICISILYQAKWRQMPVMVFIACSGYVVNYFSSVRFSAAPQIANTLGALCVGVLANLYSRLRHGVAAATLIPAIFAQVPGGLASTGGLLSGLTTANKLTNSTETVEGTGSVQLGPDGKIDNVVFGVAAAMIQIAIGIAVGLFVSALIIYPLGKRRSGLFSF